MRWYFEISALFTSHFSPHLVQNSKCGRGQTVACENSITHLRKEPAGFPACFTLARLNWRALFAGLGLAKVSYPFATFLNMGLTPPPPFLLNNVEKLHNWCIPNSYAFCMFEQDYYVVWKIDLWTDPNLFHHVLLLGSSWWLFISFFVAKFWEVGGRYCIIQGLPLIHIRQMRMELPQTSILMATRSVPDHPRNHHHPRHPYWWRGEPVKMMCIMTCWSNLENCHHFQKERLVVVILNGLDRLL